MVGSDGLTFLGIKEEVDSVEAFEDGELEEEQASGLLEAICLRTGK